ncbi:MULTISPECIES: LON peptidase substrate-binding domain-containing protein [Cyanophyceae]|uniref:LON peptidase substrate-binding domain-containing protein n=1 Tax=Cyanophyceae TaxID=3028117 RepID=UPI00016DCC25|nr:MULTISPECIES: LON peptidase substrate-binding domain-containing protein [Cyanophyceae]ACB00046.1 putative ATP-dependent proteinase [Picosynechococcus sp. PCC 7002]AMA09685.1 ATP-dependent protease [Picosynechococcus sp. PCC 73109]ANV84698.1 ATP-dependent protease [Picosynechococcus sp. PCC 7003]ANV87849.1 ATP-dependent protease [Picosynechococcus sp. PCC 7117]ANV91042.1 ATP-dependent protease [Picosynechococcus sp. PCC 8807]
MTSFSVAVRELPLFPLPELVLFPSRPLPLHVFEFRYRIMMNTILEHDRRFGVLMVNPVDGTIANVGCCAEIVHCEKLPDGRMKMLTIGQQRFRVLDYVREKPYRVGLVEWIEDDPTTGNLSSLAVDAKQVLMDVVGLSAKLAGQDLELPEELPDLPRELSFWIAGSLYGVAEEQQALLELQDTQERLRREVEILTSTRNHLAARTALKDVFE